MATINWDVFTGCSSANHRREQPARVAADRKAKAQPGARRYFILVTQENDAAPWTLEFGDYSLFTVRDERADWLDHFDSNGKQRRSRHARVITTSDSQAAIDAVIAQLNAAQ